MPLYKILIKVKMKNKMFKKMYKYCNLKLDIIKKRYLENLFIYLR